MTNGEKDILVQRMTKLSRQGWKYTKERLSHPRLPNMMYNICVVVYLNPGISQDGVSHYLQTDKSSIAKVVSRAVKSGYIRREINPEDHREYQLYLTELGTQIIQEVLSLLSEWQTKVLDVLNEREKKKFRELFDKVTESAETLASE